MAATYQARPGWGLPRALPAMVRIQPSISRAPARARPAPARIQMKSSAPAKTTSAIAPAASIR
jgi:hypothetical protein